MEMFLKLKTKNFPKVNQMKFKSAPHHFPLYFTYFKEVLLSSLMKILEWHKVSELDYCSNGIQIYFKTPFFISLNGRSHTISTLGFFHEMNLNSWRSKFKMKSFGKVLLFPLIQLSKKFLFPLNFTQSTTQQSQLFI